MKHKSRWLQGLVVFAALILFVAMAIWLSKANLPIASTYRLEVKFDSAGGLVEQAKVLMRGYKIGSVKSVHFEPDGIVVTLAIEKKYQVPAGSAFTIATYNFIGERTIDITPARSTEYLKPDSRVTGESREMMADVQALVSELRRKLPDFGWERAEKMAAELQASLEKIPARLSSLLPPKLNEDLNQLADTAREMTKTFRGINEQMASLTADNKDYLKKMTALAEEAGRNQARLSEILAKLDSPDSSAGKMLLDNEFWKLTKQTLDAINDFFAELKKNPKKFFKVSLF